MQLDFAKDLTQIIREAISRKRKDPDDPFAIISKMIREAISRKRKDSGDPDDPFALVGAPVKPRPPLNRSSIAVQPEP
jgi:hypothetical protein